MNPFDWRGPEFLAFYLVLAIGVNVIFRLWVRRSGSHASGGDLEDPYLIAFLRGGRAEAVRIATVSLVDRGLLMHTDDGQTVMARPDASRELLRRPIERALLSAFAAPENAVTALRPGASESLDAACSLLEDELVERGLTRSANEGTVQGLAWLACSVLLLGTAAIKVVVALERGRHNVAFLIVLAIVSFIALASAMSSAKRTPAGSRALREAKARFQSLRDRALTLEPGGATNEAALLAAVFGLAALPAMTYPWVKQIYPQASSSSTSGGCGGSGCGGGGSGCGGGGGGGGGCGGGCGGCGG